MRLFIAGTDTDVGKTVVSCGLLAALGRRDVPALGFKPVASGTVWVDGVGCSPDAVGLRAAGSDPAIDLTHLNPYHFAEAIAPHIAAARSGVAVDFAVLDAGLAALQQRASVIIVEGAGGWRVPLGPNTDLSDWVRHAQLPVLLVVGLRLGCISHARLSVEAILADGLRCIGWVGTVLDPAMPALVENIQSLRQRLSVPCLGVIAHGAPPASFDSLAHAVLASRGSP